MFDTGHPGAGGVTTGRAELHDGEPASPFACVQAVPGLMTAADFCMFAQSAQDSLLHLRMLRPTSELNSYMVLAKFRTTEDAKGFAKAFEGKPFLQGLVNDVCCVSGVASASMDPPERGDDSETGSASTSDKTSVSLPAQALFPCEPNTENFDLSSGAAASASAVRSETDIAAPANASCPVCLEALDSNVMSLVTTLCNHTMHLACLAKWDLDSCPVCRHTHELVPEATACMSCGLTRGLWMCVICAYVGCGIYASKHAQLHFKQTQHPFVVVLEDTTFFSGDVIKAGSVWDYVSNRFVHRLLSSDDGKVVEVSEAHGRRQSGANASQRVASLTSEGAGATNGAAVSAHAHEVACKSRTRMCNCSGGQGSDDEEDDRGLRAALYASRLDGEVLDLRAKLERAESEHSLAIANLSAELEQLRQKSVHDDHGARRLRTLERENKDLREKNGFLKNLNETLLRDKQSWNTEVQRMSALLSEKEKQCSEKDDQLRDLYLHVEAQAKVADASAGCRTGASGSSDVSGGAILGVGPSPKEKLAAKSRRRK